MLHIKFKYAYEYCTVHCTLKAKKLIVYLEQDQKTYVKHFHTDIKYVSQLVTGIVHCIKGLKLRNGSTKQGRSLKEIDSTYYIPERCINLLQYLKKDFVFNPIQTS